MPIFQPRSSAALTNHYHQNQFRGNPAISPVGDYRPRNGRFRALTALARCRSASLKSLVSTEPARCASAPASVHWSTNHREFGCGCQSAWRLVKW